MQLLQNHIFGRSWVVIGCYSYFYVLSLESMGAIICQYQTAQGAIFILVF